MKYDLRKVMKRAWEICRKVKNSFSQALKMAWKIAKFENRYMDKNGGYIREGNMTFNIWTGYGMVRAYFKASWESKYSNDKKSNFIELI